ncbi:MAG: hypothetical protein ACHQM4_06450 [Thermoanaerobaculia bacterium]
MTIAAPPPGAAPPRAERIRRLAFAVLISVLAARVLLLPVLAWNSRYVMDEYGQASFPLYIPMGFYDGLDPIKTVLYVYVFEAAHRLTHRAVDLLRAARMEGVLLSLLAAGATFGIARRLGRSRFEAWFSVSVLFSFTNFMERSFRIRSDTVAVFFATAATFVAVGGDGAGRLFLAGLLAGGAFLSTQKAVYPLAALGLAVAVSGLGCFPVRRQLARLGGYAGGAAAALLAYGMWFDLRNPFRVLSMVFLSPLHYAPIHGNPRYAYIWRQFVPQTLFRNPVPYALAAAGLALALTRIRSAEPRIRLTAVAASAVTLLVFSHDQPWPYTFVMALPFLSVFAPVALAWLEARASDRGPWIRLAACGLLVWQVPRNLVYLGHDNAVQNGVVEYAERLLGPGDRYFDGIAMVPTRYQAENVSWEALILHGVHVELAHGNDRSIRRILDSRPKLWILSYRIDTLKEYLPRLLDPSYVRIHPDVLLTGALFPDALPVTFVNRWPGRYQLFRPDGSASGDTWRLDGRKSDADGFVPEGPHEIVVSYADGPRYLLPVGTTFVTPLPVTAPFDDLFHGVYD